MTARQSTDVLSFTKGSQAAKVGELANASRNKLLPEDRPVHDWYRFAVPSR